MTHIFLRLFSLKKEESKNKTAISSESLSPENIDKNISFMIEDPKDMEEWFVSRKERKALNDKENEKFKKVFDDGTNDSFIFKFIKKNFRNEISIIINKFLF